MPSHHARMLPVAIMLTLLLAATAAMDSAAGTPRQAVPYPDAPALDWTMRPTMWGMP
ncbi:hypothetical protein [Falsiroseomonas sp. HW251]|uniref:hypothetical protein n=1 Tax=Falsiroseomonas sp. HW251 TaxID=3390998 RepID=UPI003D31FD0F